MDIQNIFYWLASVAMVLTILFLLGMVALLFYVKKKITDLDKYGKYVIHKADHFVEGVKSKVQAVTNLKANILGKATK